MSKGISFRVADMQEGGGLIGAEGPVLVRFDNCRFALASEISEDYHTDGDDPPAFGADLFVIDEDGNEEAEPKTQLWTAGKSSRLVPSSDGETLEPAEGSTAVGVTKTSNFGLFLISGAEAHKDFEEIFSNGASSLNNMIAKVERRQRPSIRRRGEAADEKKSEVLSIVEIVEIGGKKAAKGGKPAPAKTAAKPTAKAPAKAASEPNLEELVGQAVLSVLAEGETNKGKLTGKVTSLIESDDAYADIRGQRPAVVKLLLNPSFLKGLDGVEVDGTTVKLG